VFGIGTVELVVAGVLVAGSILLWRYTSTAQWVRVDRATPVGVEPSALEVPLARLLSDLPATRLVAGGPATWTISVERPQLWTFVPTALVFPLGPLFLLFKEHASVVVTLRPATGGADVQVLGTTRLAVQRAIEQALADLPAASPPRADTRVRS